MSQDPCPACGRPLTDEERTTLRAAVVAANEGLPDWARYDSFPYARALCGVVLERATHPEVYGDNNNKEEDHAIR